MGGPSKKRKQAPQLSIAVDARADRLRQEVEALAREPAPPNGLGGLLGGVPCLASSLMNRQRAAQSVQHEATKPAKPTPGESDADSGVYRTYCMMLLHELENINRAFEALRQENFQLKQRLDSLPSAPAPAPSMLSLPGEVPSRGPSSVQSDMINKPDQQEGEAAVHAVDMPSQDGGIDRPFNGLLLPLTAANLSNAACVPQDPYVGSQRPAIQAAPGSQAALKSASSTMTQGPAPPSAIPAHLRTSFSSSSLTSLVGPEGESELSADSEDLLAYLLGSPKHINSPKSSRQAMTCASQIAPAVADLADTFQRRGGMVGWMNDIVV